MGIIFSGNEDVNVTGSIGGSSWFWVSEDPEIVDEDEDDANTGILHFGHGKVTIKEPDRW